MSEIVNRRAFLATVPTLALAGCAARLGLVDRVEVTGKYVVVSERRTENGEGNESGDDEPIELARRRYDPTSGPTYDGEIHDRLADDIGPNDPLRISETTNEALGQSFGVVRYGMRGCESIDDDAGCRDTWLFLDDFNEIEVGDVVDVRYGDEMSGIVSRREQ
ncbi:hypothetical protein OB955_08445 [Halobacteria archaeon AArc-m2/3/4]|uniref:Lipoprotein n=1 Tax=Natronoglomus mannanivorans TaxID=2979990 RepID=A0AAP3E0N8_9EURY|nr:hypothetical protein [Halobacteria archaeon AArc-xg1-1]MCU4972767.1 hypothetical protein [Halobacteria archaeon AArc-m2/3/4]